MRWYSYIPDNTENCSIIYNRKCPPNNSVYEEWITVGLVNDGAQIIFVEYDFYDKDPDGVREAYDCVYDSVYNITVDTSKVDNQKLFAYTVTKDYNVITGFDIDISKTKAVYIFTKPQNFDNNFLITVSKEIENYNQNAEEIITQYLSSKDNPIPYLVILNDRL